MRSTRTAAFFLLTVLASSPACAQITEDFDSGAAGWTFDPPSTEGIGWAVDYDAGCDPVGDGLGGSGGSGPRIGTTGSSLNFNDGTDYEDTVDFGVKGYATSPLIDVSSLGGSVVLSWQNNYENEYYFTGGSFFDQMFVQVVDDTGTLVPGLVFSLGDEDFDTSVTDFDIDVGPMGTFSAVTLDISAELAAAGVTSIQVQFIFTSDGLDDAYDGWFIDNFQVCGADTMPPTAPVNSLPLDGSIVTSPPAAVLDWTDSTDTTSCGTGTVTYEVLFDAVNPPVFLIPATITSSTYTLPLLPAGTYYWSVRALDASLNASAWSAVTSFTIEIAVAPLAPGTLFVNEDSPGAQAGDAGFVDPVRDQTPVFSAVFLDPNTADSAASAFYEVLDALGFVVDSGTVTFAPPLPKDTRTPDIACGVSLDRDATYSWRIRFTDLAGGVGPFASQSFRIGDDFELGIRAGSSNHSRKCWVATAAWGGVTPEVSGLMGYRASVLENSAAGRAFSACYAGAGESLASGLSTPSVRRAARGAVLPLAAAAVHPTATALAVACVALALLTAGLRRIGA